MAFKKGHKLAKGRPPGSKNKRTDLFALCDEMKVNVFEEMLKLAVNATDDDKRFNYLSQCAPYLYSKKKEVLNLTETPVEELLEAAEKQLVESKE